MSEQIAGIVDGARLLKPGDVVAITTRRAFTGHEVLEIHDQLATIQEATGVHFVLFDDVDLEVFRPVRDE